MPLTTNESQVRTSFQKPQRTCLPWYSRMLASSIMVRLPVAEPIAWKAALLGANTVTSIAESRVLTRLACVKAPAAALNPACSAVKEMFCGTVKT